MTYSASVINSVAHSFRIFLGNQELPLFFLTFPYPMPVPKNCLIFIRCNFESSASQVGLHKQKKDTASAKEGKVSLLRRGGQGFALTYFSRLALGRLKILCRGSYHLTENFGNSGWKVNGKVTFRKFQPKIECVLR